MEFYDEKDMAYWRKQADLGKAVILEIPVSMLLDLDISSLSREKTKAVTIDDLYAWMDENKEEFAAALAAEKGEKAEVEKLERNLYDKQDASSGLQTQRSTAFGTVSGTAKGNREQKPRSVSQIMTEEVFSDEQIAVIAEAMMEELPEKYMLCFLKKEYSPSVMRQLKDYCTKIYREEVKADDGSR